MTCNKRTYNTSKVTSKTLRSLMRQKKSAGFTFTRGFRLVSTTYYSLCFTLKHQQSITLSQVVTVNSNNQQTKINQKTPQLTHLHCYSREQS